MNALRRVPLLGLGLIAACFGFGFAEPDLQKIRVSLMSGDRSERYNALNSVASLPRVSGPTIDGLIGFTKREIEHAVIAEEAPEPKAGTKGSKIPLVGDEVSLTRLKADTEKYVDGQFVLLGALKTCDRVDEALKNVADSIVVFEFYEYNADLTLRSGSYAEIYIEKFIGESLKEQVIKAEEQGKARLMRLRCSIDPSLVTKDKFNLLRVIELHDWQRPEPSLAGWQPWVFEGMFRGVKELIRGGSDSIYPLVKTVVDDSEFQGPMADILLRIAAAGAVAEIVSGSPNEAKLKQKVIDVIREQGLYGKPDRVQIAAGILMKTLSISPSSVTPKVQRDDDHTRAARHLSMAKQLEKGKKIPGAIKMYLEISKEFPGTESAKEAEIRLKALQSKPKK